jgi:hypothetical protein
MTGIYYELFEQYYRTTVGKFYTKEQCRRLLALLAGSNGMELDSEDFATVSAAVDTVESYDISGFVESKNFQLLCDILEEDAEVSMAATALVAVYEELTRSNAPRYADPVEWMIALRTATPKTTEVRLELAYLEYARGNTDAAIAELSELCDLQCFAAVEHLAYLCLEGTAHAAEAYHYLLLLKRIYEKELGLPVASWLASRLASARAGLPGERADAIRRRIEKMPPFLTGSGAGGGTPIGFNPETVRRYSYEH